MAALSKIKASATVETKQSLDNHGHRNTSSDNNRHHFTKLRLTDTKGRRKTHRSYSRTKKPELKTRITTSNSRQKIINKSRISKSGCCIQILRSVLDEYNKKCRCRYCMRVRNKGTCTNLALKEASTLTGMVFEKADAHRMTADTDDDGANAPDGFANSEYTNSKSHNSDRSSLHSGSYISNLSHLSLDHEPMVTNED